MDLATGRLAKYQIVKAIIDEIGLLDYPNYPVLTGDFPKRYPLNAIHYF